MKTTMTLVVSMVLSAGFATSALAQDDTSMSFFITSGGPGDGANLGGLEGADQHCQTLAEAAGSEGKTWHAYLSTTAAGGGETINARDRIGTGPWHNANGELIADNVDDLHSETSNLNKEASISESGAVINGRGDEPNMHDILTGSGLDGMAVESEGDTTCSNWASNTSDGSALVGHHDRTGGGANPESWNSAHGSKGCSQTDLQGTGGNGLFYCFAVD